MQGGIAVFSTPDSFEKATSFLHMHPDQYGVVGIHPNSSHLMTDRMQNTILDLIDSCTQFTGYGEIGLDYFESRNRKPDRDLQKMVLANQLKIAVRRNFPIVIHGREAERDLMDIMVKYVPYNYHGIHRHCVTVGPEAIECMQTYFLHAKFGFTNKILKQTEEAARIRETVKELPLFRILTETDAPFHAPSEWKHTRNVPTSSRWYNTRISHPGMVGSVVNEIARIKGVSRQEVARTTYDNARLLYCLK